jgi:hypothetical protein
MLLTTTMSFPASHFKSDSRISPPVFPLTGGQLGNRAACTGWLSHNPLSLKNHESMDTQIHQPSGRASGVGHASSQQRWPSHGAMVTLKFEGIGICTTVFVAAQSLAIRNWSA